MGFVFALLSTVLCGPCRATAPPPLLLWPPLRLAALRTLPTATFAGWLYLRTAMPGHAAPSWHTVPSWHTADASQHPAAHDAHIVWPTILAVAESYLLTLGFVKLLDIAVSREALHLRQCSVWTSWLAATATLLILVATRGPIVAVFASASVASAVRLFPPMLLWHPPKSGVIRRPASSSRLRRRPAQPSN